MNATPVTLGADHLYNVTYQCRSHDGAWHTERLQARLANSIQAVTYGEAAASHWYSWGNVRVARAD